MARTKQTVRKPQVEQVKVTPLTVNQKKLLRLRKATEKKYLKKFDECVEWSKRQAALKWMEKNHVEDAYFARKVDPEVFKRWIKDHFDDEGVINGGSYPAFVRMIESSPLSAE